MEIRPLLPEQHLTIDEVIQKLQTVSPDEGISEDLRKEAVRHIRAYVYQILLSYPEPPADVEATIPRAIAAGEEQYKFFAPLTKEFQDWALELHEQIPDWVASENLPVDDINAVTAFLQQNKEQINKSLQKVRLPEDVTDSRETRVSHPIIHEFRSRITGLHGFIGTLIPPDFDEATFKNEQILAFAKIIVDEFALVRDMMQQFFNLETSAHYRNIEAILGTQIRERIEKWTKQRDTKYWLARAGISDDNFKRFLLLDVSLSFQIDDDLTAMVSEEILDLIIGNVMTNATKAVYARAVDEQMRHQITLTCSTEVAGEKYRLIFDDNGRGFPQEKLDVEGKFHFAYGSGGYGTGIPTTTEGMAGLVARLEQLSRETNHHFALWGENNSQGGARIILELDLAQERRS